MQVPVNSGILVRGSAGLYQITIQLPANVSTGAVAVQGVHRRGADTVWHDAPGGAAETYRASGLIA